MPPQPSSLPPYSSISVLLTQIWDYQSSLLDSLVDCTLQKEYPTCHLRLVLSGLLFLTPLSPVHAPSNLYTFFALKSILSDIGIFQGES